MCSPCPTPPPPSLNVTVQQFQAFFAGDANFASTSSTLIQFWLDQAPPFFDICRWDDLLVSGVLYWIAHQITWAIKNSAQPLTDDTSRQQAGQVGFGRDSKLLNDEANNPYLETNYGRQYLYYMRFVGAGATAL